MTTISCPGCSIEFAPKRSNQKFCSRNCQKSATAHASRGTREVEHKARSAAHYERAGRLFEMLYAAKTEDRLGVMQHILSFVPTDAVLRNILTDPKLLSEGPGSDGRKNISKAANAYTKKFFGLSITTYVQRIKDGVEVEGIEVKRTVDAGPMPMTEERLQVLLERRHRPLSAVPKEIIEAMRTAALEAREADPELHDKLTLRAAVKQAQTSTRDDHDRVSSIVAAATAAAQALAA